MKFVDCRRLGPTGVPFGHAAPLLDRAARQAADNHALAE